MKRTHKNSTIALCDVCQYNMYYSGAYVLQVELLDDNKLVVEFLDDEEAEEYRHSATETPAKNTLDMEYENALTTVLNNDPQGIYSGKTLEEIFNDPNGARWVDWALKNMHNKFILDRVKIIYNKRSAK